MAREPVTRRGVVYLVGAGPGAPELITVGGVECLRRADVVLYDSLVNERLLELARPEAVRVPVGKRHGRRCMPQEAVNELLVEHAQAGRTVVRLKGGDPFVFGRGGEEAMALRAAGVPYEVVPGVTAGVAVPAFAGIPITHRGLAYAVALVTGHLGASNSQIQIDWSGLAGFPGTLVFYMGVRQLPTLTEALLRHGKPPTTPAAFVQWGTTPAQRTVIGTLGNIAERVKDEGLATPATIVIGEVARLASDLHWFEDRPLFGQRIVITRPAGQFEPAAEPFRRLGAEVLELPALRIELPSDWNEVDEAIANLRQFDWLVFTSANGVRIFLGRVWELGNDARLFGHLRIAAIGAATARELEGYRLKADLIPEESNSESLVASLRRVAPEARFLLLRAEEGRQTLPEGLRAAGISFRDVAVYRTVEESDWDDTVVERIARGEIDWITVTSPRIVRTLAFRLPEAARAQLGRRSRIASISPLTSSAARELGIEVAAEAKAGSIEDLIEAILAVVA